jgi:hypothetical protein
MYSKDWGNERGQGRAECNESCNCILMTMLIDYLVLVDLKSWSGLDGGIEKCRRE